MGQTARYHAHDFVILYCNTTTCNLRIDYIGYLVLKQKNKRKYIENLVIDLKAMFNYQEASVNVLNTLYFYVFKTTELREKMKESNPILQGIYRKWNFPHIKLFTASCALITKEMIQGIFDKSFY